MTGKELQRIFDATTLDHGGYIVEGDRSMWQISWEHWTDHGVRAPMVAIAFPDKGAAFVGEAAWDDHPKLVNALSEAGMVVAEGYEGADELARGA